MDELESLTVSEIYLGWMNWKLGFFLLSMYSSVV